MVFKSILLRKKKLLSKKNYDLIKEYQAPIFKKKCLNEQLKKGLKNMRDEKGIARRKDLTKLFG